MSAIGGSIDVAAEISPILDRGRAALRIPTNLLPELVRYVTTKGPGQEPSTANIHPTLLSGGALDSVAAELVYPIGYASLKVDVSVHMGSGASVSTVWATPNAAVVGTCLDPALFDLSFVTVSRLPDVLAETIVLRRPRFTAQQVIAVPSELMVEADRYRSEPKLAAEVLQAGGDSFYNELSSHDLDHLLAFQSPQTRRWRITTTWSTDRGFETVELRGLDAGAHGQWTVAMAQVNQIDTMVFTPKGDGQMLAELRNVFPRHWVNTPLRAHGMEMLATSAPAGETATMAAPSAA